LRFCIKIRGSLLQASVDEYCVELEECIPVYRAVEAVLRKIPVPVNPENIAVFTEDGHTVDPGEDTCRVGRVIVSRIFSGG